MKGALTGLLLGVHGLYGVVDRLEGGYAVVEWQDQTFSDVPLEQFARPVNEGQSVRMRLRAHRHGAWLAEGALLRLPAGDPRRDPVLPAPWGLTDGQRYLVLLEPMGGSPATDLARARDGRRAGLVNSNRRRSGR